MNNDKELEALARSFEQGLKEGRIHYLDYDAVEALFAYYRTKRHFYLAHQLLEQAQHFYPYNAELYYKRSQLFAEEGDLQEAIAYLQKAISIAPYNSHYQYLLGKWLLHTNQFAAALQTWESLLEQLDDEEEYVDYARGIALALRNHGEQYATTALDYLWKAYHHAPQNGELFNELIECMEDVGEEDKIQALLEKRLKEFPSCAKGWFAAAQYYYRQGAYDIAVYHWEQGFLLEEDPEIDELLYYFHSLLRLKHYVKVVMQARDLFLQSKNGALWELLRPIARACYYLQWYSEALFAYKRYLYYYKKYGSDLEPISGNEVQAEIYKEMGYTYLALQQLKKAEETFSMILDMEKLPISLYDEAVEGLAKVWLLRGKPWRAYELLLKNAVLLKQPPVIERIMYWSEQLKRYVSTQSAVALLEEIFRHYPLKKLTPLLYQYSAYLFEVGRRKEAFNYLENALLLDYDAHHYLFHYNPQLQKEKRIWQILMLYKP